MDGGQYLLPMVYRFDDKEPAEFQGFSSLSVLTSLLSTFTMYLYLQNIYKKNYSALKASAKSSHSITKNLKSCTVTVVMKTLAFKVITEIPNSCVEPDVWLMMLTNSDDQETLETLDKSSWL